MPRFALLALTCALPASVAVAEGTVPARAVTCTVSQGHTPAGKIVHRPAVKPCPSPARTPPATVHATSQRAGLPVMSR